ncbi:MAG: SRPBCC family protein [Bacteroidia bacterium]|jgi:effector-binding domain-containing protein
MKILKKIGIILLVIILLLLVVSFFLPRKVHVERSLEMKATPETVFALVNELKAWEQWSPWHKIDPEMTITYSDITAGSGAFYEWKSKHDQVGNGKLSIVESHAPAHIKTQMDFEGMDPAYAEFNFEATTEGVKVTWTMDSDMGMNPIAKFFGLMMDKFIGPDYEKGLANLKELSEKAPLAAETIAGCQFEERQLPATLVAGIREKVNLSDLTSAKFGAWYAAIGEAMHKANVQYAGSPVSIYYSYDSVSTDMEAAVPVTAKMKDDGNVKCHEMPATKALVVKYYGDYTKTGPVYNEAFAYMAKNGMQSAGAPMEIYVTDPGMEKDTSKWLTEIAFPIQ